MQQQNNQLIIQKEDGNDFEGISPEVQELVLELRKLTEFIKNSDIKFNLNHFENREDF